MAKIELIFDAKPLLDWGKDLNENIKRLKSFTQRVANIMHADINMHFITDKKDSKGMGWANVKNPPKSGSILARTGTLRQSFWTRSSDQSAEVGTNIEYSRVHNFGFPQRNIPQREFMWISENAMSQVMTVFNNEFIPD